MIVVRVVICWLLLCLGASAHEITFSQIDLRLGADETSVVVKLPPIALLQEVPSSLPSGVTADQLAAYPLSQEISAALSDLIVDRLKINDSGELVALMAETVASDGADIVVTAAAPVIVGRLDVSADLFPTDPLHKVFVSVYRGETLAAQYVLDTAGPSFVLAAPERPILEIVGSFVLEGIHHIFIGPDHVLFVIALILLGGRLWAQLKIITAFTVAHSITLALATLNIVSLPSQLVESVIALSIVVVGVHDLWQIRNRSAGTVVGWDPRTAFAFAFGLVHGFGFASVLQELDLPREALAWSLAAFNVGVEIGQLTIVLAAAPVVALLASKASPQISRAVLSAAATVVVTVGSVWLWQRIAG